MKLTVKKILFAAASFLLAVLLLFMVWFFFLPKKPFKWLTMDQVESVEMQTDLKKDQNVGYLDLALQLTEEDQEAFVEALQNLTVSQFMRKERKAGFVGRVSRLKVTLKNGSSFFVSAGTHRYCTIYTTGDSDYNVDDLYERVEGYDYSIKCANYEYLVTFWLPEAYPDYDRNRKQEAADTLYDIRFRYEEQSQKLERKWKKLN